MSHWESNKSSAIKVYPIIQYYTPLSHSMIFLLMWVKECHQPSPSRHHVYRWSSNLPFPVIFVVLWHGFTHMISHPTMVDPMKNRKKRFRRNEPKAQLQDGSRLVMSFRRHEGSLFQTLLDSEIGMA